MIDFFIEAYQNVPLTNIILEFIAFVFGILSVWFAKKENIWVYPSGLIGTTISIYLFYVAGYLGDMLVNLYYSIMSVYGWYIWSKGTVTSDTLPITRANFNQKLIGLGLFLLTVLIVFGIYKFFDYPLKWDNYVDIFVSGIFFVGMWLMAKKKLENWTLWIIGDLIATPLYAYRGLGMIALQYLIFTILAVSAYFEWKKNLNNINQK